MESENACGVSIRKTRRWASCASLGQLRQVRQLRHVRHSRTICASADTCASCASRENVVLWLDAPRATVAPLAPVPPHPFPANAPCTVWCILVKRGVEFMGYSGPCSLDNQAHYGWGKLHGTGAKCLRCYVRQSWSQRIIMVNIITSSPSCVCGRCGHSFEPLGDLRALRAEEITSPPNARPFPFPFPSKRPPLALQTRSSTPPPLSSDRSRFFLLERSSAIQGAGRSRRRHGGRAGGGAWHATWAFTRLAEHALCRR